MLLLASGDDEDAGGSTPPAAGSTAAAAAAGGFPRTITDSGGTKVEIEAEPERIVSLSPAATEILFAIGAGDRVVGTDAFSNYPAEAEETAKLDYSDPDPEAALALDPDLVIMPTRQQEQVAQFRDLGMTVLYLEEAEDIEGCITRSRCSASSPAPRPRRRRWSRTCGSGSSQLPRSSPR
jgi:iron complex transport system substrate-binding protein